MIFSKTGVGLPTRTQPVELPIELLEPSPLMASLYFFDE